MFCVCVFCVSKDLPGSKSSRVVPVHSKHFQALLFRASRVRVCVSERQVLSAFSTHSPTGATSMHGGPPSEVVRHLYYYNTLEPGVQSAAPDDLHHHHPLPAVVAMDPSGGGRDSRYNLNYSMSIGLNMAEGGGGGGTGVQDMYGNPTSLVRPGMTMNNSRSLMGPNSNNNNNNNTSSTSCLSNNSPVSGQSSGQQRGIKRTNSDCFDDRAMGSNQQQQQQLGSLSDGLGGGGVGGGGVVDVVDDSSYASSLQKKSPPANGKKTKGRVKIKMEYIDNKLRRYTTFSKRKTGIMKKVRFGKLCFRKFTRKQSILLLTII